jgi:hypothetical protein
MRLAERLHKEFAMTSRLPLTAEGRKRLPCHPVEEMDISEIERIMEFTGKGFIQTESEDEACDLCEHMEKLPIIKEYNFDLEFPSMLRQDDNGHGQYLFAYEKKSLTPK